MVTTETVAATPAMSVSEAITRRRAVRTYLSDRVEESSIRSLLTAATWAPTAVHEESWAFAIVQDTVMLKHISDTSHMLLTDETRRLHHAMDQHIHENPSDRTFNIFYDAGTLIVIYAIKTGRFVEADCWLAAENLMLTACAMGLGTCVIGYAVPGLNDSQVKYELKVPPTAAAIVPIIVGTPRGDAPPTTRKPPMILSWK
jgi:nitroreductase